MFLNLRENINSRILERERVCERENAFIRVGRSIVTHADKGRCSVLNKNERTSFVAFVVDSVVQVLI